MTNAFRNMDEHSLMQGGESRPQTRQPQGTGALELEISQASSTLNHLHTMLACDMPVQESDLEECLKVADTLLQILRQRGPVQSPQVPVIPVVAFAMEDFANVMKSLKLIGEDIARLPGPAAGRIKFRLDVLLSSLADRRDKVTR